MIFDRIINEKYFIYYLFFFFFILELPVNSPLIHGTLAVVAQWQETLREELDNRGPPINYIPACAPDPTPTPGKPAIHKYRSLLEKSNTPFK